MQRPSHIGERAARLYWLHVHADGREEYFAERPLDLPTLRIEVVRKRRSRITERTGTKLVYLAEDLQAHDPILVWPRGVGWDYVEFDEVTRTAIFQRERPLRT